MSNDIDSPTRRRVLRVSGGAIGVGLFSGSAVAGNGNGRGNDEGDEGGEGVVPPELQHIEVRDLHGRERATALSDALSDPRFTVVKTELTTTVATPRIGDARVTESENTRTGETWTSVTVPFEPKPNADTDEVWINVHTHGAFGFQVSGYKHDGETLTNYGYMDEAGEVNASSVAIERLEEVFGESARSSLSASGDVATMGCTDDWRCISALIAAFIAWMAACSTCRSSAGLLTWSCAVCASGPLALAGTSMCCDTTA